MKSTEQPRKIIEHDERTIDFHKNNNHTHKHKEKNISFKKLFQKTHTFFLNINWKTWHSGFTKKTYMPIIKKSHIEIIKEN